MKKIQTYRKETFIYFLIAFILCTNSHAQTTAYDTTKVTQNPPEEKATNLAKQLANPISSLISVPMQFNARWKGGIDNKGFSTATNFQPVIPFSISKDWNLIMRVIVPVISTSKYTPDTKFGLGDIVHSFFLSPKKAAHGIVWGAGPVILWPSATDRSLGQGKLGVGPTAVGLTQQGKLTAGLLANHVWSVVGPGTRENTSATFLQPFFVYGQSTAVILSSESTYNWKRSQWTVPIYLAGRKMLKIGSTHFSADLGGGYYVERPDYAPKWALRTTMTLLLPKKK
ncbi:hypothetical protein C1637_18260 [Chryseobacterium lactis]|uniref:Neuromedin U n=1 Tax=Chryseobacterium lactis TaxID=1241981 RepID=A0A3G6RPG1_CHRLC|nr:hypothetical protein [Chryseobacterium lactis]AZA84730.1 hypothetical protein EG342_23770 [Chryseobacterium lactis]AZB05119.1 hypothetical protein EG341_14650 [Chryseobacterium lactis]PNW12101.1 hypothetical protein C1637_18260 [Chryseobacterium lactis]